MTIAAVAVAGALILSGNKASAEPMKTVKAVGERTFRANKFFNSNLRFVRQNITVDSGDMVTFANDSDAPHTVTIVTDQLATNWAQSYLCLNPSLGGGACLPTVQDHEFGGISVLEQGEAGLDVAGDSLWMPLDGEITAQISAPSGTVLKYTCALHPWMQGTITVK